MRIRAKSHIGAFTRSLSFKLLLILLTIMFLFFAFYVVLYSTMQKRIYEHTIELGAYRNSDIIKNALYRLMLKNEREELFNTIKIIGNEPGLEDIRIYNKKGEITFSTYESETGTVVDMKAEACYACHAANEPIQSLQTEDKTRIYEGPKGYRIMGMINPIRNAPECSNQVCHAHNPEQTILGVLDVRMSLNELDQAVFQTRVAAISLSFGLTILALVLFSIMVYIIIYRPIKTLQAGTVRLAVGDLDYRIDMKRRDELGMLAQSFNNMAENLKKAYQELKDWSNKLEKRVDEKTDQLEKMHKGLIHVEKMASLGKMAASVAHELNNPLAGIVTYSKLIQKRIRKNGTSPEDLKKIINELELISSESMRCGNIVRNLLAFARETSANFQEFNIEEIINRGLEILSHHMQLAGVEFEKNIRVTSKKLFCDAEQLVQALIALFVNAVEAMPDGGTLNITVEDIPEKSSWMRIKIADTGIGISAETLDKIFEPFFTTKEEKKGVGLGLPVVYGIIQRHRGKIRVESEKGKGSTFIIELPRQQTGLVEEREKGNEDETV